MSSDAMSLAERLRRMKTEHKMRGAFGGMIAWPDAEETREVPVNPDGLEAAVEIDILTEQLRSAVESLGAAETEIDRLQSELTQAREALAVAESALEPFAAVADEYAPQESDYFEVWKDAGPERVVRAPFRLGLYRNARQALSRITTPSSAATNQGTPHD